MAWKSWKNRDDAIYCERPNGAKIAYIPYYQHELLAAGDYKVIKWLARAVVALTVALVAALVIR